MSKRDVIFILMVLAVGVQLCAAEELQWLQYRSSREARSIVGDMGSQSLKMSSDKPEGIELPEFKGEEPLFAEWSSPMVEGGHLWIALDRTHKHGPHDSLFIDSNGDGRLSDESATAAYRTEQNYTYFGPVKVVFEGEDGPISYHLNFRFYGYEDRRYLYISPGGWYEGDITVGGEKKYCVLIDQNVNGTFNDKSIQAYNCDRVRIGKKDERDTRFVGNYIEIDGAFYRPEIARDGAYIKLEAAEDIRFGKVKMQEAITGFSAGGENGLFAIKLEKGVGELPVGKYRIDYWAIERKDDGGSTWELRGQGFGDKGKFEVNEEGQTELTVGEPIISNLKARIQKTRYSFNQEMKGQLGERISLTRSNSRPRAPKLHIKSGDGKYDRTFNFEYG
jgi:hypothetical protein